MRVNHWCNLGPSGGEVFHACCYICSRPVNGSPETLARCLARCDEQNAQTTAVSTARCSCTSAQDAGRLAAGERPLHNKPSKDPVLCGVQDSTREDPFSSCLADTSASLPAGLQEMGLTAG